MDLSNRSTLRAISERVSDALKNLDMGADFAVGNCRYETDGSQATFKLIVTPSGVDVAKVAFDKECYHKGLLPEAYGATVSYNGEFVTISGINVNAKKYPYQYTRPSGAKYKAGRDFLRSVPEELRSDYAKILIDNSRWDPSELLR
jgi:hypothetical protein